MEHNNERAPIKTVRPDSAGRVTLGNLADGVSSFHVFLTENNELLLKPFAEIPTNELWLFNNKEALSRVHQGIQEIESGETHEIDEDFTKYIED